MTPISAPTNEKKIEPSNRRFPLKEIHRNKYPDTFQTTQTKFSDTTLVSKSPEFKGLLL